MLHRPFHDEAERARRQASSQNREVLKTDDGTARAVLRVKVGRRVVVVASGEVYAVQSAFARPSARFG